jgi:hypothetical protein
MTARRKYENGPRAKGADVKRRCHEMNLEIHAALRGGIGTPLTTP